MGNFDNSANYGEQLIIKLFKDRMIDIQVTQKQISELTGISEDTLTRYFNRQTKISLPNLIKICGALELRPYFIPAEMDNNEEFKHVYFN
ncbi:XRE family transcriptional regulator [Chryseobacterium sp. G0240]|uniref:helix-turn-helix domain-containing protein n=1 Tax=Chryseobacterium sp. G0240 TaxID=2487066 RepID=UPI000F454316|nr:helix-turn-helix transcriptional regulator [Chryseobacterium sp. G0240]ROI02925.1 XRE family transcriptional regulator [Chryseobacterium sp. G0240]